MYQALYRKYRPQTFDDVVGQQGVTQTLKNQLQTGRLSHAYLFTGTRGTGALAAHGTSRLMLLGSPPDMIRGHPLRETGSAAACGGL